MTNKQDDAAADLLIREVDEDLRQDQMQQMWKRYGRVIIGGAVAVVLAVAGWQGYSGWQKNQRLESSQRFAAAQALIEGGDLVGAETALAVLAGEGADGYRVLARFEQANLLLRQGQAERALAVLGALAADGSVDDIHRGMARLKAAYLRLDGDDPAQVARSVETLAGADSPWRHSAREIQALAAIKQGDNARAGELLRQVAEDPAAPQGVRGRAAEILSAIGETSKG